MNLIIQKDLEEKEQYNMMIKMWKVLLGIHGKVDVKLREIVGKGMYKKDEINKKWNEYIKNL